MGSKLAEQEMLQKIKLLFDPPWKVQHARLLLRFDFMTRCLDAKLRMQKTKWFHWIPESIVRIEPFNILPSIVRMSRVASDGLVEKKVRNVRRRKYLNKAIPDDVDMEERRVLLQRIYDAARALSCWVRFENKNKTENRKSAPLRLVHQGTAHQACCWFGCLYFYFLGVGEKFCKIRTWTGPTSWQNLEKEEKKAFDCRCSSHDGDFWESWWGCCWSGSMSLLLQAS